EKWDTLWIVDPIDGTKEFIKRNGEFTVNIALIADHIPVIGVIYVPVLKELYYAEKGNGSFKLEGISNFNDFEQKLSESKRLPLKQANRPYQVVASKSHLSPETVDFIDDLRLQYPDLQTISKGSSLKLCMVAEGIADCYPRFAPTMEWDTAAGQAICMYAGKKVIDYNTKKEMLYNREELLNNWFLVK
ncbi:MAG: 3'(2'),5'-bisphosphate nucleotidase CysQ, partial [Leeuwenhoekiella sp.]